MKKILFTIITVFIGYPIFAQEVWSLRQCIDYAIEHNIDIRKTANAVEESQIDVNTSKWARLPNLNGSADQNWGWGRTKSPDSNSYTNRNNANTGFSLGNSIPLFTGFEISNQYALSKLNFKAAVEDLNKAKQDIAINVASAYLQALLNLELHKVAVSQSALSKEQFARIEKLLSVGKASPAELAEAKARVAQDEMNVVQSDNNYKLTLLDLSQLLELPSPEKLKLVSPEEELTLSPLTPPDDIYTEALAQRPEIKAAELRVSGADKSIKIAQSSFYPQLSLNAGIGSSYYTVNGKAPYSFGKQLNDNLNQSVGFSLNIPIFNRFATRNKVRAAKIQKLNKELQLDNTKKVLYKEIQQAWYKAVAAESKYNSSEIAVKANEESFHLMSEKFANGKATSVEYNEAKLNLTKALSDKIQSKYDYLFRSKILDFYKGKAIE